MELEQVRMVVVAMVGRDKLSYASGSSGGTIHNKVGEDDERDAHLICEEAEKR